MREVNCNLCGANDYRVVYPAGRAQIHQIVSCNRCGLMYANPQVRLDCDEYAGDSGDTDYDPASEWHRQYFEKQSAQLPDNLKALKILDRLSPEKGKLLEIGCFLGLFLKRICEDGWQGVGLEPCRPVANYARKKLGLDVIDGVLPKPGLASGQFQAAVMLHVIEHVPDPAEVLQEIHRLLQPGGALVVETPRYDSLCFKFLGRRERSVQCPGHVFFFTERTLAQLLERNGFQVLRIERVGRTLTLERLLYNIGLMTRSRVLQRWIEATALALQCNKIRFHINVRDMQRMYARATPITTSYAT